MLRRAVTAIIWAYAPNAVMPSGTVKRGIRTSPRIFTDEWIRIENRASVDSFARRDIRKRNSTDGLQSFYLSFVGIAESGTAIEHSNKQ